MADNIKKLVYNIEINDKGKVKVDGITKGFVKMDNAIKKVNLDLEAQAVATNKATAAQKSMIATSGLAGATLTEFGRTISDFNYGIRGIANNLSQLSSLFITLVAKAGGFGKAMTILKTQLMGPLGFILAFQTVIMLLERYSMNSDKAKKSTEDFSGSITKSLPEITNYLDIIDKIVISQSQLNTLLEGAAASDKKFSDFLEKSNLSSEERNQKIKEYLSLNNLVLNVENDLKNVRKEISEKEGIASLEEIEALESRIKQKQRELNLIKTGGQQAKAAKELELGLLKEELALKLQNASEITELSLKESELFIILLKYRRELDELTEQEGRDRNARVKTLELEIDFRKKFFLLDKHGRLEMIKGYINYMDEVKSRMQEEAEPVKNILKNIGVEYDKLDKRNKDNLKAGLKFIKDQAQDVTNLFRETQKSLGYVNTVVMSYHDARMASLARERDYILNSGSMSASQQREAIADIEKREIKAQRRKIKAERDLFTIKQSLLIAEEIMKIKADIDENKRILVTANAKIIGSSVQSIADAKFSIGKFAQQQAGVGLATYAISIGGMIASIMAARKKAQSALAGLGAPSSGGGGGGAEAPDFNIVGASPESQLAQSVSTQQKQPLRAFVVHNDIKDADELSRKVDFNRSLG